MTREQFLCASPRRLSPISFARSHGLELVAFHRQRGGWQALALGPGGDLVWIYGSNYSGGRSRVTWQSTSIGRALWFLACCSVRRSARIISKSRLAVVLLAAEMESRNTNLPAPLAPPSTQRWFPE